MGNQNRPESQHNNLVLNGEYELMSLLGNGKTAMVYLAKSVKNPTENVAVKILKRKFIHKEKEALFFAK